MTPRPQPPQRHVDKFNNMLNAYQSALVAANILPLAPLPDVASDKPVASTSGHQTRPVTMTTSLPQVVTIIESAQNNIVLEITAGELAGLSIGVCVNPGKMKLKLCSKYSDLLQKRLHKHANALSQVLTEMLDIPVTLEVTNEHNG